MSFCAPVPDGASSRPAAASVGGHLCVPKPVVAGRPLRCRGLPHADSSDFQGSGHLRRDPGISPSCLHSGELIISWRAPIQPSSLDNRLPAVTASECYI
jgi:hypothetical protein